MCEAENPDRYDNLFFKQARKLIKAFTELEIAWVKHIGFTDQATQAFAQGQANQLADALGMELIYPAPVK